MKYVVLVGDGMADHPVEELGGRTPLEVADTPNMDRIVAAGQIGQACMVPAGFSPGSDVAILSILGYDPGEHYPGRAPLEAAKMGIDLGPGTVAFRCNLITVDDGLIKDYSAGHISSPEGADLIQEMDAAFKDEGLRFYPGVGYRHICVVPDTGLVKAVCTPPHDVVGRPFAAHLPQGPGAEKLRRLMNRSRELLTGHRVNQDRIAKGQDPANMIWLWGQGQAHTLPSFHSRHGMGGAVISAVDLVKGMALLAGLDCVDVPGATGYYDTDYLGKALAALENLKRWPFVLVHLEAPDEAGHNGDLKEKIRAIENFDRLVVGTIIDDIFALPDYRVLVLPDHPTPLELRTHTGGPIPFAWAGSGIISDKFSAFNERNAFTSSLRVERGHDLIGLFLR